MTGKGVSEKNKMKKTSKKNNTSKKLSENYWAISTVVLALALVVLGSFIAFGASPSGAVIGTSEAGQKVVDFAAAQGAEAELITVNDDGSLYEVIVSIQGQEVPVYITKDGKDLIPQKVPMSETEEVEEKTTAPAPEVVKSDKPVVEAFVMSHCPYGTQIEKGLIPVMKLLGDKIDAEIKFVYYAMHPSAGEVEEQLNQYCIQEEQNDLYISYLECFLEAGDGAGCIEKTGVDKSALTTCTSRIDQEFNVLANLEDESSWLSGRFPKFDIHKAENEAYEIGGSPTLVINGEQVSTGRDSASLKNAICAAFNVTPEECDTELSSASPSPGFGYSTTTATTDATCN